LARAAELSRKWNMPAVYAQKAKKHRILSNFTKRYEVPGTLRGEVLGIPHLKIEIWGTRRLLEGKKRERPRHKNAVPLRHRWLSPSIDFLTQRSVFFSAVTRVVACVVTKE
jgi:hypothetical protein